MAQVHYRVVQNKACPIYFTREDIKTSELQKLEAWLIHPVN